MPLRKSLLLFYFITRYPSCQSCHWSDGGKRWGGEDGCGQGGEVTFYSHSVENAMQISAPEMKVVFYSQSNFCFIPQKEAMKNELKTRHIHA